MLNDDRTQAQAFKEFVADLSRRAEDAERELEKLRPLRDGFAHEAQGWLDGIRTVGGDIRINTIDGCLVGKFPPGAALLRWRPNQSLRRRRGRRQLDPSRRGEERQRVRWPTVLLSSATDGGLPLVLARFVRGLSTHQDSGCLRRLRTAATAAKCHRAPVDSHRVADQMPTGPSMSRGRAPHAASPLPRG